MTDKEIIKALECCLKGCNAEGCDDCPLYEKVEDCEIEIPIIALDLINRQKAEVERLEGYNANLEFANQDVLYTLETEIKKAKSEAIREFAEQHKELMRGYLDDDDGFLMKWCEYESCTDNLVKGMTEDSGNV